ncbi:MAG: BON domain-containing protein [Desulfatiglandales bacterium]
MEGRDIVVTVKNGIVDLRGRVETEELRIDYLKGRLTLKGVLPSEASRQVLLHLIQDVLGVVEVDDPLRIDRLPWQRKERTGWMEDLARIRLEDLKGFHRRFYPPGVSILTVAGDVSLEEIEKLLSTGLGQWQESPVSERGFRSRFTKGPEEFLTDHPISQANVVLGHTGIRRSHPD